MSSTPSVFISYSHSDAAWRDRIVQQLRVLELQGDIELWEDTQIPAGDDWKKAIDDALASASVALLLISADSLTSPFILASEVPDLLVRRASAGLRLIPVVLRDCPWEEIDWLSPIQAFPMNGTPLASLADHEVETQLAKLARDVAQTIASRPTAPAEATPMTVSSVSVSDPSRGTNNATVTSLTVLCDFFRAYRAFEWGIVGALRWLDDEVVSPMHAALQAAVPSVTLVSREIIAHAISDCEAFEDGRAYGVTLDGRTYFRGCTEFALTRVAYSFQQTGSGPYDRGLRHSSGTVGTQAMRIKNHYATHGDGRPVVVCDDGIGTGRSLREAVRQLHDHGIEPSAIVVLVNPHGVAEIEGIEVVTLLESQRGSPWINERDLYWGLPRSGVTLGPANMFPHLRPGVPYSFTRELLVARVGIDETISHDLRRVILSINQSFWQHLEEAHGRPIWLRDSIRLRGLVDQLGLQDERIADVVGAAAADTTLIAFDS